MFLTKKKETKEIEVHELAKIVWTLREMREVGSSYFAFKMRVQGKHPITGGTSVVHYDSSFIKNLDDVKRLVHSIIFGLDFPDKNNFIDRVNKKVVGGYACEIEVSGRDDDGDTIDYEFESKNQSAFMRIIKNGVFQLEKESHKQYMLLEY